MDNMLIGTIIIVILYIIILCLALHKIKILIIQIKDKQELVKHLTIEQQDLIQTIAEKKKEYAEEEAEYAEQCRAAQIKIDEIHQQNEIKIQQATEEFTILKQQIEQDYEKFKESTESKKSEFVQEVEKEKSKIQDELSKLDNTLQARIAAQLREKEIQENKAFYTLQLSEQEIYETEIIRSIESKLKDPRPLRMVIWSNYYLKKANDLCARVLGSNKVCGIYKITNTLDEMCYIGQAKDIKERWREHMKCGLGIDTPFKNALYEAMKKDSLSAFTFELLEKCSTDELNEKEKHYIDAYQSKNYGYNNINGISKK